jgi:hypothetical protein
MEPHTTAAAALPNKIGVTTLSSGRVVKATARS